MSTIKEYFLNDFKGLCLEHPVTLKYGKRDNLTNEISSFSFEINMRLQHFLDSSTRMFTFYIPETEDTFFICQTLLNGLDDWKSEAKNVETIGGFTGDKTIGSHLTTYSNRIYFYSENPLLDNEIYGLDLIAKEKNIFITLRSKDYLFKKTQLQRPMAFISHDSKDKELIAKPLANGLNSRLCYVWYDEYSLKIGDSLRESIEKGIKEAKKCILILTPNFLNNPGWTKKEFNSIFTREMIFNEKIVLPIWFNVKRRKCMNIHLHLPILLH